MNVLNGIPADQLYDDNTLLAALEARFGNSYQAELNRMKLKNRVRKRGGSDGASRCGEADPAGLP